MADEQNVDLIEIAGRTVVEWSQVEALWAYVFRDLLYYGIGAPPQKDEDTGLFSFPDDEEQKQLRTDAVYFCLRGFDNQWQAISRIADLALAHRSDIREELVACSKETKRLGKRRDQIVHAYYDHPMAASGTVIEFQALDFQEIGKWRRRPDFDVTTLQGDIAQLKNRIRDAWFSVMFA